MLNKLRSMDVKKQQALYGGITAGLGGIASLAGQHDSMMQEANSIQTEVGPTQRDASGKPAFGNIGLMAQATDNIHPQGADGAEIGSGALSGASTGAEIGSLIPGVGTLVGGAIGAIGGAISSIFGGDDRKTEMEKRKNLAKANVRAAQMQYNAMMGGYQNTQAAQSQYSDMTNTDQRIQNLYTYNAPR